jgi:hypothetical protein
MTKQITIKYAKNAKQYRTALDLAIKYYPPEIPKYDKHYRLLRVVDGCGYNIACSKQGNMIVSVIGAA